MFDNAFTIEDGFEIFKKVNSMSEQSTSIFTENDQVAAGLIKAAIKRGYNIPGDFSVIGYDDQLICQVASPTITSIKIPILDLGKISIQKILRNLKSDTKMIMEVTRLPVKLIIREST